MQTDIHFWSYLAQFFLVSEMFQTKVVQKIKTHILCSVTFSRKSCHLWDKAEKNVVERGRPQMAIWRFAWWIPKATEHTLRICNIYCYSTTTMVARTCLIVTSTDSIILSISQIQTTVLSSGPTYDMTSYRAPQTIKTLSRSANCKVCKPLMFQAVDNSSQHPLQSPLSSATWIQTMTSQTI